MSPSTLSEARWDLYCLSIRLNQHFCFLKAYQSRPPWCRGGLSLIFDGLVCKSVYISHLTFFRLGPDCRRRWKCRVGATDRHAIALWPLSFTSRQTGRVKSGPSLIWTNAVSVCVTWAPGENALWMTDISLLCASINHNPSKLSLLASVLLFIFFYTNI